MIVLELGPLMVCHEYGSILVVFVVVAAKWQEEHEPPKSHDVM